MKQDSKEAAKWYRLAADQGDVYAQMHLGFAFKNGEGVLQDYEEAAKWLRLAADQGYAAAHRALDLLPIESWVSLRDCAA